MCNVFPVQKFSVVNILIFWICLFIELCSICSIGWKFCEFYWTKIFRRTLWFCRYCFCACWEWFSKILNVSLDLKLQPYHNEFGQNDLLYESRTFAAHDLSWMVHACVRCHQNPVTGSVTRCLGYRLMLRSKPPVRFQMSYMLVKGPGGTAVMDPMLYDFRFSEDDMETPFRDAPCRDPSDVSALLAAKSIHMRLALMQVKK